MAGRNRVHGRQKHCHHTPDDRRQRKRRVTKIKKPQSTEVFQGLNAVVRYGSFCKPCPLLWSARLCMAAVRREPNATYFGPTGLHMAAVRREPPGIAWDNPAVRAGRLAPFRCHFATAFAIRLESKRHWATAP